MGYLENYKKTFDTLEGLKHTIMTSVVSSIKTIETKPLHVGNYWFYYVEYEGKEVPGYCHQRDYNKENPKFLPIYDEDNTGEFGWSDFTECCRIFDLIKKKIFGEVKK